MPGRASVLRDGVSTEYLVVVIDVAKDNHHGFMGS